MTDFHTALQAALEQLKEDFDSLIRSGNTEDAWGLWCNIIEDITADFLQLKDKVREHFMGRGKPHLRSSQPPSGRVVLADDGAGNCDLFFHSKEAHRLLTISRRATQWISRLKAMRTRAKDSPILLEYLSLNSAAMEGILKDIKRDDPAELSYIDLVAERQPSSLAILTGLMRFQQIIHNKYIKEVKSSKQADKIEHDNNMLADPFHRRAYKIIKGFVNLSLTFLERSTVGPQGQPIGSITSIPSEIDGVIRADCQQIYEGNVTNLTEHASWFIGKYGSFLFSSEEFKVPKIDGHKLFLLCTKGPFSAGGLDGWCPADWSVLPEICFYWLADLLNTIEDGAPWPQGQLHGKASFLRKDPLSNSLKTADFRLLLLLPTLYRRWATYRLGDLQPWVQLWKIDGLYAGIPGFSADDAWWTSGFLVENATLLSIPFSGGAMDIFKCFDQISRQLLQLILGIAGMPQCISEPYFRFHETLSVYNSIAGGLGDPYFKRCSIPQGCPFSMMFIALLLRPLLLLVQSSGILVLRILADDILLLAFGEHHLPDFVSGFEQIAIFLSDMGSRLSPHKSFLFSSTTGGRDYLGRYVWDFVGGTIKVVQNFRDLGAHMSIGAGHCGTTLTNRMQAAIVKLRRLRWLPHDMATKIVFVLNGVLSGGLYGCEATHVNESEILKLATSVASALGIPSSARASTEVFFNTLPKEVEPWAFVFINRVSLLRRILVKHGDLLPSISDTIQYYTGLGFPGTLAPGASVADAQIAPPFGHPDRGSWKAQFHAYGPIGELLYSAAHFGVCITPDFQFLQKGEVPFNIYTCPFQYLKPLVVQSVRLTRCILAAGKRTCLQDAPEWDFNMLRRTIAAADSNQQPQLRWYTSLADWDNAQLGALDFLHSRPCDCGAMNPSFPHLIWDCPCTQHIRDADPLIKYFSSLDIPDCLRHGIPTTMHPNPASLPWSRLDGDDCSVEVLARLAKLADCKFYFGNLYMRALDGFKAISLYRPELAGLSARQVFAHLRGPFGHLDLESPSFVADQAAATIGTYTDGSLTFPTRPDWSLGGIGIAHMQRCPDLGLCSNESTFSFCNQSPGATTLWAPLPGQFCSSTRTEIAAGLLALSAPHSISFGTDSAIFLRTFNTIHTHILEDRPRHIVWGLHPNGDLWALVEQHIRARGPHSIQGHKLKAHTSPEDVAKGVISLEDRAGNGLADSLASKGGRSRDSDLHALSAVYASKHRLFECVLRRVHAHFSQIFAFISDAFKGPRSQLGVGRFLAYQSPHSFDYHKCVRKGTHTHRSDAAKLHHDLAASCLCFEHTPNSTKPE